MASSKSPKRKDAPTVAILMGSTNDWDVMQHAAKQLRDFGVSFEARALSAHRTPELLAGFVQDCVAGGTQCFIAGAGGAAHLAGVVAALTTLPVLAVPIPSKHLGGLDSLLSMVQMPKGIPVATFAIGDGGSANAGLFAVAMLALNDGGLAKKLQAFRAKQAEAVKAAKLPEL
ncbi:MAG TPA: 5-(carboxyamino)imidazole ribonucleotide mutase [Burkholderiales bacterium]|nr:5-(carboxyamino)imidazole ribonucleotide mutase [Burkholderiales bacterium]